MAAGTTPLGSSWQGESLAWPLLAEAAFVAVVIAALLPLFAPLSASDTGRDGRFGTPALAVHALPHPVLRELCATHAKLADAAVRDRLCARADGSSAPADRLPAPLAGALARAQQALDGDPAEAARPLACAAESLREAFTGGTRAPPKASDASRANAVLLTAAAL